MSRNKALSSETHQSILVQRNEGYSMREIAKKLRISYNAVYYSLHRTVQTVSNQNRRRSGRPRCTTEQEDKYIRVSSLRNRRLTSPQLAASLNSTRKTPVSASVMKRLWDAGLLGRVAKKKPNLRLANTMKRLRWEQEHKTLDRGNLLRSPVSVCVLLPILIFLLASLRFGFFFATLPRRTSRSRLFTVDVETGVLPVLFNGAAS